MEDSRLSQTQESPSASHPKGRCWKQAPIPYDSVKSLDSGNPIQETAALDSGTEEEIWKRDVQGQKTLESSSGLEKRPSKEEEGDKQLDHEREDEQTFLVNLYKFMKERNTPIERVPHLGFKQINLWKIHQAVENFGGYELVTGRRLWKNVYDKLGGSPGSTSAATCTRRHYERLVLPYIWNMKGENGKPLPTAKPRKQYRLYKEKREETEEKNKKMRKERNCEQIPLEKESNMVVKEKNQESNQETGFKDRSRPPSQPDSQNPGRANCCSASSQRLISSLYGHGIMSPLAKKKLLAQASEAGNLCHCGKHGSPDMGDQRAQAKEELPDSGRFSTILQAKSPSAEKCPRNVVAPSLPSSVGPEVCSGKDPQNSSDQPFWNHSATSPAFTGSFHAYRSDFYKPFGCNPLSDPGGYVPAFKSFTELSVFPSPRKDIHHDSLMKQNKETDPQDQITEGRSQASRPVGSWNMDGSLPPAILSRGREGSPFHSVKGCWIPPMTHLTRVLPKSSSQPSLQSTRKANVVQPMFQMHACSPASSRKWCMEEMEATCRKKMKTESPIPKEVELKDKSDPGLSKFTQPLVNKPKPLVPCPTFPVLTQSAPPQNMYKERMMVSYPTYLSHVTSSLKSASPELPSLPFSPFVFPPFSGHLLPTASQSSDHSRPLVASLVPYPMAYDRSPCHRLYPMPAWQMQPACASLHRPVPQLNTSL